jgi:hypothetical protein
MGALAQKKDTHIAVVVPMVGYTSCAIYASYIVWDERVRSRQIQGLPRKDELAAEEAGSGRETVVKTEG